MGRNCQGSVGVVSLFGARLDTHDACDMQPAYQSHLSATTLLGDVRADVPRGSPLDTGARRVMESSFDVDLSAVRVHDNPRADRLARSLDADAFAVGSHVFFRAGAYRPRTDAGLWLLAHEVSHSIQQALGTAHHSPSSDLADLVDEVRADQAADRVLAGKPVDWSATLEAVPSVVAGPPVIQRHGSWEHRLLGDGRPDDLNTIAQGDRAQRTQLLNALRDYLAMWRYDPDGVTSAMIKARYGTLRTVKLKASGLLVTYGELNTLPDYVANSAAMDDLPRDILRPMLQAVRQEGFANVSRLLGINEDIVKFQGSVSANLSNGFVNDIWESIWLDDLTANLPPGLPPGSLSWGTDTYSAILARNACHFAPYSWYRWKASYDKALEKAQEFFRTKNPDTEHEAWIHHGYADHFLQDSFAGGHLINKTLVMQWFVEWAPHNNMSVPDWPEVQTMTTARQPGLAARGLYSVTPGDVRDPQTTQEQPTRPDRVKMSGVRAENGVDLQTAYQNYLVFLNNSVVQASTLLLHDYVNRTGLYVASKDHPAEYLVYGDGTMLNGGDGVKIASETAQMSQQSIQEVLERGTTQITPELIRSRFPSMARSESTRELLPLQQWSDSMRARAENEFKAVHDVVLSYVRPRIGHISADMGGFILRLSRNGMEGYLSRGNNDWAVLSDRNHATRLRVRLDGGAAYYGTDDDKWLSVGTVGDNQGYVGLYGWKTTGYPDWKYDVATRRLSSGLAGAQMGIKEYSDGHIYCYSGAGYVPAEVELEYVG